MHIFINGKPTGKLTGKQKAQIFLADDPRPAKALSAEEATRRAEKSARIRFLTLAVIAAAIIIGVFVGVAIDPDVRQKPALLAMIAGGAAGCAAIIALGWRKMKRDWRARLHERVASAPSAGTIVRAEEEGLVIGSRMSPWSQVSINALWLLEERDAEGSLNNLHIERLDLLDAGSPLALDMHMIDGGLGVLATVYRRLGATSDAHSHYVA